MEKFCKTCKTPITETDERTECINCIAERCLRENKAIFKALGYL
jgi:hypothetical protein